MNNKKLKITEAQYNRMLQLMTETPFDTMAKQNIQVGDVIRINWKNSNNNFKVINNSGGQIIMDNIDKGSTNINNRYFMSFTSLNGDDLDLRKVNKVKEQDKIDDIKSWSPITVKDLTNIQVFRDGQLVDTVDPMNPTAEKQQKKGDDASKANITPDFMDEVNNDLAIIIEQLQEKKGINFIFNSGFVNFCCVNKTGQTYLLDVNKDENTTLSDLNKWDNFFLELKGNPDIDNLYVENKDIVSTSDGKTYNLKFKVSTGTIKKEIIIKAIEGVSILRDCISSDEDKEDSVDNESESDEETLNNANNLLQMIVNDKDIQNIFYRQPTFWSRFKSDLKNKKASGSGIVSMFNIMNKFIDNKVGKGFIKGKNALFLPLEEIVLKIDENGVIENYTLPMVKDYIGVRKYYSTIDITQVLQKEIPNSIYTLRILVKEKTEEVNIKLCEVEIGIFKNGEFINKIKNTDTDTNDVRIKFFNSDGYDAQADTQTQTTN